MARNKQKADHRADTRGGAWAGLPHVVLDSLAYRHLSLWARAILIEIVREMNGYNNGRIGISQRTIAERLATSNFKSITRATAELMEHGLIEVTVEGGWKQRRARQYRLTFVNTGAPGRFQPATNEYRNWKPAEARELSGADTVSAENAFLAEPVSAEAAISAEPVSAAHNGKPPFLPIGSAEPVSALIYKPYPCTELDTASAAASASPCPPLEGEQGRPETGAGSSRRVRHDLQSRATAGRSSEQSETEKSGGRLVASSNSCDAKGTA